MKEILIEWNKFLTEKASPKAPPKKRGRLASKPLAKPVDEKEKKRLENQNVINTYKSVPIAEPVKSMATALNYVKAYLESNKEKFPDVSYPFAEAMAKREAQENPYAVRNNTYYGIFQVGPIAAGAVGEEDHYKDAAKSLEVGTRAGLRYLQYMFNILKRKFTSKEMNDYGKDLLAYMSFNLGADRIQRIIRKQTNDQDHVIIRKNLSDKALGGATGAELGNKYIEHMKDLFRGIK